MANFQRFNQKDDLFRRSWWDERIRSAKSKLFYATYREPVKSWRKAEGFTQKDYALRNAAWHVSDLFTERKEDQDRREGFSDEFTLYRDVAPTQTDLGTRAEAAAEIKRGGSSGNSLKWTKSEQLLTWKMNSCIDYPCDHCAAFFGFWCVALVKISFHY